MTESAIGPLDILIVDDNPAKLLAMQQALEPLDQNLITADSGREALRQLLEHDFATIVLDVSMPDIDGFETAQMIRSRPRSAHTPIIFVSAVNMDEIDARRGYALGAVDYILAPIVPEVLRAKVSVFVALHRKTEEARLHARALEERTRELEQSQRRLNLAERMAMIGTLCAGLGHDMANLLLPISVQIDAMRPEDLPESMRGGIDSIRSCVSYLRKLCSGLRLLALDPDKGPLNEVTDLAEWWTEARPIMRNSLPRSITLEFRAEPQLPPARIARHLLTQTVFNLVQNAGEAMSSRGEGLVRVTASNAGDGETLKLCVSDSGPGMDPEVLKRCFDPFFTTKSRGISTGLGLALVHGILKRCGGEVDVTSEPGRGTTFSFSIPAGHDRTAERPLAVISLRDARVRGFASEMLRGAGFDTVPALPRTYDGPAIWITDLAETFDKDVEAFVSDRNDRHVLVHAENGDKPPQGVPTFGLFEGAGTLRQRLRDLREACLSGSEAQRAEAEADAKEAGGRAAAVPAR